MSETKTFTTREGEAIVRTVFNTENPDTSPRFLVILALRHDPTSWSALWVGGDDTTSLAELLENQSVDILRRVFSSWQESIARGESWWTRDPRANQVVTLYEEHGCIPEQIDRRFGLNGREIAATRATIRDLWRKLRATSEPLDQMPVRAELQRQIERAADLLECAGYSPAHAEAIAVRLDLE